MKKILVVVILTLNVLNLSAQQKPEHKLPPDLVRFFTAEWRGEGNLQAGAKSQLILLLL